MHALHAKGHRVQGHLMPDASASDATIPKVTYSEV